MKTMLAVLLVSLGLTGTAAAFSDRGMDPGATSSVGPTVVVAPDPGH